MIKIGCAAYSYRELLAKGSMRYEDFIEEVYRMKLDGVELTLYWLPSMEGIYLRELKRFALFRGLPIYAAGTSCNFCQPEVKEREKQIAEMKKWVDVAQELGAPCLRIFGGRVPEGHTEAQATQWAIEALKSCTDYAEDKGVVLALENHGGVTMKADNLIKIVKEVNSKWLAITLDVGNYRGEIYDEIAKTAPYAVNVHARQREDTGLDYTRIKSILEQVGYNGFVSIEYEGKEPAKTGVPKEAKYLLDLFGRPS